MENVIAHKFAQLKTEVMKAWTDISHAEMDGTHGKLEEVIALLQKKFGYAREEAATKLMELAALVEGDQSAVAADMKTDAKSEMKTDVKTEDKGATKH